MTVDDCWLVDACGTCRWLLSLHIVEHFFCSVGSLPSCRLQQLADIGAASSRRLPAINILLTMPAQYWEGLYAEVAAAKEQSAERRLAAAAAAAHDAAGAAGQQEATAAAAGAAAAAGQEVTRGGLGGHRSAAAAGDGAPALTSMQAMQRSAARALSRLRGRAASPAGAVVGSRSVHSSGEEEEEAEEVEAGSMAGKGLLGGDAVWKSSLQDAILGTAAELGRPWRAGAAGGRGRGEVVQQQAKEQHGGKQEVAGAAVGGRSRRRR